MPSRHIFFLVAFLIATFVFVPFLSVSAQLTGGGGLRDRTSSKYAGTWELGSWATSSAATYQLGSTLKVTESAENAQHLIQQYIDVPSSQWWQLALKVTPIGARNIQMYVFDANNQSLSSVAIQCGLSGTGSILSKWAGPGSILETSSIVAHADGSYTCTVGGRLSSTTSPTRLRLIAYPLSGTQTQYQGDGVSGFTLHSSVLSGNIPAPSCTTKAYSTCGFVQSLFSMREGFGAATTGGLGGDVVTVTNLNDTGPGSLRAALMLLPTSKPVWVKFSPGLSGTIALQSPINVPSNRTLDGRGANITLSGNGLNFFGNYKGTNDIVNNISIKDITGTENDAISIANLAKNIWIHRTTLSGQSGDGLLDITNGATDITISWSAFADHDKVMAINSYETTVVNGVEQLNGHELDFYDRDKDARVTLHHNTFVNTGQRHPRAVFGKVHMYNNLFSGWGSYGIGSSFRAQTLAEGNLFEHTGTRGNKALLTQVGIDPEPGFARLLNNLFGGTALAASFMPELVFSTSYQYRCQEANEALKTTLLAEAGAHILDSVVNTTPLSTGCPAVALPPPPPPPPAVVWETVPFSSWLTGNATWTGTTTSGVLTENQLKATHMLQQYLLTPVTTGLWRLSFEIKPVGLREMRMYLADTSNQSNTNIVAQCVPQGAGSIRASWKGSLASELSASATALPDGWYKCTLSGRLNTVGTSNVRVVLQLEQNGVVGYQGDGTSGAELRNLLLERNP